MNPREMTKRETVAHITELLRKKGGMNAADEYFFGQIAYYVERSIIADIRDRQSRIPGLRVSGHGCKAVWGGELTPGCRTCLDGTGLWSIRATNSCNLDCDFCYCKGLPIPDLLDDHFKIANSGYLTSNDIKIIIDKQGSSLDGIAWVSFEPFTQFEKHLELIEYLNGKGIHQWIYTNGTLLTEERMKRLQAAGLDEIRFNLAASKCSLKVIKTIALARQYFKYLCVESPMTPDFLTSFIKKKNRILDTGIDQINCAELHVNANNAANYLGEALYGFKYGYISPVSSRNATYDLMQMAADEGWQGITINDCSNETKFYRGVRKGLTFGEIDYGPEWHLPADWYFDAIENYPICTDFEHKRLGAR
ncbi:MAG: radical SAM protein [Candidatus Thiodiazotropha sp. (ex Epidulcina cf. delphinae)]|nr:radical SAM protein [Candidatus Thiodiazotropha sp. (ex Epidulcina cf. delphinae)]